jgi:hypothetical protein
VCRRCQFGIVLLTPAADEQLSRHPFVIVDRTLSVQAVSRLAQALLQVDEVNVIGTPVGRLLTGVEAWGNDLDLADLVTRAVDRASPSAHFALRTVADPQRRFGAQVAVCGPPPAALLMLTAVDGDPTTECGPLADSRGRSVTYV